MYPTGADTIDGGAGGYDIVAQYNSLAFRQTGTNSWALLGGYGSVAPEYNGTVQTSGTTGTINVSTDILVMTNVGNATYTLPSAAAVSVGKTITFKQTGALVSGTSTILAAGANTLDGAAGGSVLRHTARLSGFLHDQHERVAGDRERQQPTERYRYLLRTASLFEPAAGLRLFAPSRQARLVRRFP